MHPLSREYGPFAALGLATFVGLASLSMAAHRVGAIAVTPLPRRAVVTEVHVQRPPRVVSVDEVRASQATAHDVEGTEVTTEGPVSELTMSDGRGLITSDEGDVFESISVSMGEWSMVHRYFPRRVWRNGSRGPTIRRRASTNPFFGSGSSANGNVAESAVCETFPMVCGTVATLHRARGRVASVPAVVTREAGRLTLDNASLALVVDLSDPCVLEVRRASGGTRSLTIAHPAGSTCTVRETAPEWDGLTGAALAIAVAGQEAGRTVTVSLDDDDSEASLAVDDEASDEVSGGAEDDARAAAVGAAGVQSSSRS